MELVLYHKPSGTLLTCDLVTVGPDRWKWIRDGDAWQTPVHKFGSVLFTEFGGHHTWIAADCAYSDPFHSYGDLLYGMSENCSNWKVDPVAMLRARQFLSTELNLSGGVYGGHWGVWTALEFRKSLLVQSGWLHRYELMARLPECANVSGASMVLQPCDHCSFTSERTTSLSWRSWSDPCRLQPTRSSDAAVPSLAGACRPRWSIDVRRPHLTYLSRSGDRPL
eukprot:UN1369